MRRRAFQTVKPEQYDAWYETPRGRWIAETEHRLLEELLAPASGESLLDIGCGTGYFTRQFARRGLATTGIDIDPAMIDFARTHAAAGERYLPGDARALPFADCSFDLSVSVTALCFVADERRALAEMLRVTRRRIALGLLNRRSLLHLDKGRDGGRGAYRGAHWHTRREIDALFEGLPVTDVAFRTAILFPWGWRVAAAVESVVGECSPWGGFIVAACTPGRPAGAA
jgi:ubiquinone/menaquinone biosynthesis C-methylase UbiE